MAVLNEEQTLLADAARGWARDQAPRSTFRAYRDGNGWTRGLDAPRWAEMGEMGWCGVIIPEAFGGSAMGLFALGLILEQTGRHLVATPLHSTAAVAASALILGGNDAQKAAHLPRIAAGKCIAALALDEGAHFAPYAVATAAVAQGDGFVLNGRKRFIADATAADLLIVVARSAGAAGQRDGLSLFLVDAKAAGVSVQPLHAIDDRGAADIILQDVHVPAARLLAAPGQGADVLDAVLDRAAASLAAEMLGSAAEAFDITLDYLKTRNQFGQLIGSFQALQHRAAKMFTELELTRSAVEAALEALDAGAADTAALASLAKARANDTLHLVSNEMVQMHGGIGMTDAFDAGLFLKRARVAEARYGGASYHRDRYARLGGY